MKARDIITKRESEEKALWYERNMADPKEPCTEDAADRLSKKSGADWRPKDEPTGSVSSISKESYETIGRELGALTQQKNNAYGDSFRRSGLLLKELYPDGVAPEQYQDMLAVVRVIDKLFRIATDKDAFGESPWKDVAGYGILMSGGE